MGVGLRTSNDDHEHSFGLVKSIVGNRTKQKFSSFVHALGCDTRHGGHINERNLSYLRGKDLFAWRTNNCDEYLAVDESTYRDISFQGFS